MDLTALGVLHTIVSLVAVAAAIAALVREHGVSPTSRIGRVYIWSLVATCVTGLPIFRRGAIGPPHILGVLTLATLAVAAIARKTGLFGRASAYVETISYSVTLLFLGISTVTETLTRVPPSAPLVAGPEAAIFQPLYLGLLVLFLIGVTVQIRRLGAPVPSTRR
ncbi:MAG: hypothetical protein ACRELZ_21395 [Candidatus Rokuibacteriota bacterium]